jgi:hypothetical protein
MRLAFSSKGAGWALVAVGALSTVPIAMNVIGKSEAVERAELTGYRLSAGSLIDGETLPPILTLPHTTRPNARQL